MKRNEKIFLSILILIMIINTIFNYKVDKTKSIIELIIGMILYTLPIINNILFKFKITRTIRYLYYILIFLVYYLCVFIDIKSIMNYHGLICLTSVLIMFLSLIIINKIKNKNYMLEVLLILLISIIISIVIQTIISLINNYDLIQFFKSVLIMLTGTSIGILWYLYEKITNTKLFITNFIEEIRDNYE